MPPAWAAGKQELEQEKLASAVGWMFAATEEAVSIYEAR